MRRFTSMLLLGALVAGCGGGDDDDPTRLERAFESIPGKDPVGSGYGWVDVDALRDDGKPLGEQLGWASDALGPDAKDLGAPSPVRDELGLDAADANAIFSITSNYAFSMRLDGVDPEAFSETMRRSGATEGELNGWTTFDLGSESSIPLDTPAAPIGSLAARTAVRVDQIALARRDIWRANLIDGERDPAIDADLIAAGAECLGDVDAARFMLNNHTYLPGLGPDLHAFGVLASKGGPATEVFCAIDEDPGTVDEAAGELEATFGPGGRDALTGKLMADLFSQMSVEEFEAEGLSGVRVALTDAPRTEPGEVFAAADTGSVMTWMGFQRPPKADDLQ